MDNGRLLSRFLKAEFPKPKTWRIMEVFSCVAGCGSKTQGTFLGRIRPPRR